MQIEFTANEDGTLNVSITNAAAGEIKALIVLATKLIQE